MKKVILTLAVCGMTAGAFAQGFVTLLQTTSYKQSFNGAAIGTTAGFASFAVLEWALGTTPVVNSVADLQSASWLNTGIVGNNSTSVPTSGKVIAPNPSTVSVGPWAGPGAASYVIIGWTGTEGNLSAVLQSIQTGVWADTSATGGFGWSTIGNVTAGAGPVGVSLWGASGTTVNSGINILTSNVAPVPEPATIALAGLGGLALLALRRKK